MKIPANSIRRFTLFLLAYAATIPSFAAPPQDHSYVRGAPTTATLKGGAQGVAFKIPFIDTDLPDILGAPKYASVDIVMQQCFGGGFVDAMKANPPAADWTACSASAASKCSWYLPGIIPPNTAGISDNFSRAWREDALRSPATGMKQHFTTADEGNANPKILPDRFSKAGVTIHYMLVPTQLVFYQWWPRVGWVPVPGPIALVPYPVVDGSLIGKMGSYIFCITAPGAAPAWIEVKQNGNAWQVVTPNLNGPLLVTGQSYVDWVQVQKASETPQYASAGAASDNRTFALPNPNPDKVQQYAILAQWDYPGFKNAPTADFAVGISRMYQMLTGAPNNVPTGNIDVLYFNGMYADGTTKFPAFTAVPGINGKQTEDLPVVPLIDGPTGQDGNTPPKWEFADVAVPGDLFTTAPDFQNGQPRLFVFFNGHGCRSKVRKAKVGYTKDPNLVVQLLPDISTDSSGSTTVDGFDAVAEFEQAVTGYLAAQAGTNSASLDTADILENTNSFLDGFQAPQDLIQISTTKPIPPGVQLIINGFTNTSSLQPINDASVPVYDLDPLVPGLLTNTYTYQVSVDNMFLYNATTNIDQGVEIDLQFQNLGPGDFDPDLIAAVIVRGAAQEVAYLMPEFEVASGNALTAQDYGDGVLLTWPPGANNLLIQQNPDLLTTNWMTITNQTALIPELTGIPDPSLPMGTNWAFISYTNSQMFFRLQPPP